VSYSRHNISFRLPPRDIRVNTGAESLISELKVRHLLEEQYQKGFEAGQKSLSEQLIEQRRQLHELQSGVLRKLQDSLPEIAAECEKSLVLLALESAKRVVHETPINATLIENTVKAAIVELKDTAEYEVLLNPADLALLAQMQSGLLPATENTRIRFTADTRIARADCIVKTKHGSVAANREHLFDKMESALLC
jgi:flagellar biosynthesis/type III secretory pathway protein FliH